MNIKTAALRNFAGVHVYKNSRVIGKAYPNGLSADGKQLWKSISYVAYPADTAGFSTKTEAVARILAQSGDLFEDLVSE